MPRTERTRKHDRKPWKALIRENWYRDLWLFAITLFLFLSQSATISEVDRQKEGRGVAIDVVCGVTSAIIDSGRAIITGTTAGDKPSTPFEKNLEKLGYPPREVRKAQAEKAASEYAKGIVERVEQVSGIKGLVDPKTGTLNCARLRVASKTGKATPTPNPTPPPQAPRERP